MDALSDDLTAETPISTGCGPPADLAAPTPAPGWTVGDQISHLWFFDQQAMIAADPDAFARDANRSGLARRAPRARSIRPAARSPPGELLDAWRQERAAWSPRPHARPQGAGPWYGPAMSARSFITARLMETWAHGQDVSTHSAPPAATDRLRHVAHIGVGARPFSYVANGLEPDAGAVGSSWSRRRARCGRGARTTPPTGSPARRIDFCLLVTQRRHRDDVALVVEGPAADDGWHRPGLRRPARPRPPTRPVRSYDRPALATPTHVQNAVRGR